MPVFSTVGSLAEFRQGYTSPLTPLSATATPANPGIGAIINVVPNTSLYTGSPEIYIANSNVGNFTGNSVYPNTTFNVVPMEPFANYTFDVRSQSAGGYSNGNVTTNNVNIVLNSSLTANANLANFVSGISITDPVDMTITPDGSKLLVANRTRLQAYDRNSSTGNLTLVYIKNAGTGNRFDGITASNNYFYVQGLTNSNTSVGLFQGHIGNGDIFYTFVSWGGSSLTGVRNKPRIANQGTGNIIYLTFDNNPVPNASPLYKTLFVYNIESNGYVFSSKSRSNLGAYQSYNAFYATSFLTTTDDGYHLLLQDIGATTSVILNYKNVANGNISPNSVTTVRTNNLPLFRGLSTTKDGTSIYTTDTANLITLSRNTSNGFLTISNTQSILMDPGVTAPLNNVYLGGNSILFSRDTSNGFLTTIPGYTSFSYPDPNSTYAPLMTRDGNNIYVLNGNATTGSINIFQTRST